MGTTLKFNPDHQDCLLLVFTFDALEAIFCLRLTKSPMIAFSPFSDTAPMAVVGENQNRLRSACSGHLVSCRVTCIG